MHVGSEGDLGPSLHLRVARALLQHLPWDHDTTDDRRVHKDGPQLPLGVVFREVDRCHGLEAF